MFGFDQALLILAGVAGLWFAARFLYRPKGSGGGLGQWFRREPAQSPPGIGLPALRTMIEDLETLMQREQRLRGLVLAGPFVSREASAASHVTAIFVSTDLSGLEEPAFLDRWPYLARGHEVLGRKVEKSENMVLHRLTLRGAPPVELAFILPGSPMPPILAAALQQGATLRDPGTGDAEKLLANWNIRFKANRGGTA